MVKVLAKCCMAKVLRNVSSREGESNASLHRIAIWLPTFIEDVFNQTVCDTIIVNDACGSGTDVCSSFALFERSIETELDQQNPKGKYGFVSYDCVVMLMNTEVVRRLWVRGAGLRHGNTSPCERQSDSRDVL